MGKTLSSRQVLAPCAHLWLLLLGTPGSHTTANLPIAGVSVSVSCWSGYEDATGEHLEGLVMAGCTHPRLSSKYETWLLAGEQTGSRLVGLNVNATTCKAKSRQSKKKKIPKRKKMIQQARR